MILHSASTGNGMPIVLLHGMAASTRYWDNLTPALSQNHRVIALDLLGFGHSPKPKNVTYDSATHLESVLETLDKLGVQFPVILVGHSMGALLALKLAVQHPDKVSKLVLLAMPIFDLVTAAEAKDVITRKTKVRELAFFGNSSHVLCVSWCTLLRPVTRHVAPLYLKYLPKLVAQDSLLHTWQAFSESLDHVIIHQDAHTDLAALTLPTTLIYGNHDTLTDVTTIQNLSKIGTHIVTTSVQGGHNIGVYSDPEIIKTILN